MKTDCILIRVAALVVLVVPLKTLAEEVYSWTGDDGQVHFSDRAPQHGQAEINTITPASGKASPYSERGLRAAEHKLLEQSRRREKQGMQARRLFVSRHAAVKSSCSDARLRYDQAKRKPGAAKSPRVKVYYEQMRERCR
ncbi:MAG: DUF4124 domain-containing protein [Gammaproteobacteria bacterium]